MQSTSIKMCPTGKKHSRKRGLHKMKRIHWPAKINEAKMDHFPLIDFHCPLYVDSHFCNFLLFVVRRAATRQCGCSQHLARPFPFHWGWQHTGKKFTLRKQGDSFLVNGSQHIHKQAVLAGVWSSHTIPLTQWPLDFIWPRSLICYPVGTKTYPLPDSTSQYSRRISFYKKCHPSSANAGKFKSLPRAGADTLSNWMPPL